MMKPQKVLGVLALSTLEGAPNPTEDGARLWTFVAAGGEVRFPFLMPFSAEFEETCRTGEVLSDYEAPRALALSGEGFSITAAPGETATFAATGAHAGGYQLENVNVTWVAFAGGDATERINFRITRAD